MSGICGRERKRVKYYSISVKENLLRYGRILKDINGINSEIRAEKNIRSVSVALAADNRSERIYGSVDCVCHLPIWYRLCSISRRNVLENTGCGISGADVCNNMPCVICVLVNLQSESGYRHKQSKKK